MPNCADASQIKVDLGPYGEFLFPDKVNFGSARGFDVCGYVYVIGPVGEKRVNKIGSAKSVLARLKMLQSASWQRLQLRGAVPIICGSPVKIEFAAHTLAGDRARRLQGEWFSITPESAIECIAEAAKAQGAEFISLAEMERQHRQQVAALNAADLAAKRRRLGLD